MNATPQQIATSNALQKQLADFVAHIEVVFGTPSKDCKNYGICKVAMKGLDQWPLMSPREGAALAELTYRTEQQCWCLRFLKASLTRSTLKKHFEQTGFLIQEAFVFSRCLDSWPDTFPQTISAGRFEVCESEEWLIVDFIKHS